MIKKEKDVFSFDYSEVKEKSKYMDHTIVAADFFTGCPNPYRINYMMTDMSRFRKRINKGVI